MAKLLFIADPVEKLKPMGDSSLALLRAALRAGHSVDWCVDHDVEYSQGVAAWAQPVLDCAPDALPRLGERRWQRISFWDAAFIRKDPPFDKSYVRLCWLLAVAEPAITFVNRPSLLLRYHEKMIPLEAVAQGFLKSRDVIPTHIGSRESAATHFLREHGTTQTISKPFLGFGGGGVFLQDRGAFDAAKEDSTDLLIQPFHDEVKKVGDRRVFLLEGNVLAHFVRLPKEGGFISNLAQGGSAVSVPLSADETAVLLRLGAFLKAAGIVLAGADLIGPLVSEVNITSPTGLRSLQKLEGKDYSDAILAAALKRA